MSTELEILHKHIESSASPEDIFGTFPGLKGDSLAQKISKTYRRLAIICHPDQNPVQTDLANRTFNWLNKFRDFALSKVNNNTYGDGKLLKSSGHTKLYEANLIIKDQYRLIDSIAAGDIADLHLCDDQTRPSKPKYVFKIARQPMDNELLERERRNLGLLKKELKGDWNLCVPEVKESFLVTGTDGTNKKLRANVLEFMENWHDGEAIRKAYPAGLDAKNIAWMWKRLILLLDWTHKIGLIHGAVLPQHVMYYPDNDGGIQKDVRKHALRLVDWCYSVPNRTTSKLTAWCADKKHFYPPEVLEKKALGPWTDLYMGAKTMLYLAGGDVETNQFPSHLPTEMVASLKQCLELDPTRRPQDARLYFEQFRIVLLGIYGPPKYHKFIMPK